MKDALLNYCKKAIVNSVQNGFRQFDGVVPELKNEIQKSFLVPRTIRTNLAPFREKFGFVGKYHTVSIRKEPKERLAWQ